MANIDDWSTHNTKYCYIGSFGLLEKDADQKSNKLLDIKPSDFDKLRMQMRNKWVKHHRKSVKNRNISTFIEINNQTKVYFIQQMKKRNTERKRQSAVKQFHVWFHRNPGNETRDITEMQPGKLVNYLGSFRFSIRKADGSDYELDTLTNYHGSIDRFLRERKKCPYSLITYRESSRSKTVLTSKRKELKRRVKRQFIKCSRPS